MEAIYRGRPPARPVWTVFDCPRDHPPGRVRRFDTRFFAADASAIAHRVEGVIHADAELVELVWVEIGSKPLADLHAMTRNVLGELEKRLATGPLTHDAPVPFFHFYGGRMHKDVLGRSAPSSKRGALATKQSSLFAVRLSGLLRGACHRARIRATRWLAMTVRRKYPPSVPIKSQNSSRPCVMPLR